MIVHYYAAQQRLVAQQLVRHAQPRRARRKVAVPCLGPGARLPDERQQRLVRRQLRFDHEGRSQRADGNPQQPDGQPGVQAQILRSRAEAVAQRRRADAAAAAAAVYQARADEIDRAIVGESARWGDNRCFNDPFTRGDWVTITDGVLANFFPHGPRSC